MKEKPRLEKHQPQPQPAINDLAQALKEDLNDKTEKAQMEMEMENENEKPIVFEHKPRAKEQLDKN
ncbi:hypothetical protein FQN52_006282, partial [Onygenales sp. PD_12]